MKVKKIHKVVTILKSFEWYIDIIDKQLEGMGIMSRIASFEVQHFLDTLRTSNAEARAWLKAFQKAVIAYTKETRVSGKAVEASKAYFEASYVPLVDTILQAMEMSENLLAQYIQDFYSQVDNTPDAYIDAELLQDVMADVRRLKREKERIAQSMGGGMGTTLQGQQQAYSMRLYEVMEEEKILEKYIAFEQSHTHFFAPLRELVCAVQRAMDALQNQVHFNAETGMYGVAKTFMPAMQRLQQSLNEARGIDPKREAQLEGYLLFKVPYTDSNGKEQAMWILEKDGVRVPNRELEAYLKRTGDYQDKAKYTILTLDELNEKIMKSWQNKTYYMDGKVYSGAAGSILKASAYVEDWEGQLSDAGVMDALTGVGLSLAAISGSMVYKGGSAANVPNPNVGVVQSRINVSNGQTRFTPLRKSGEPVSAGFDHVFEGHFDRPLANSRSIFSTSADNLKQILQSQNVVKSTVMEIHGGQYKRIVDTGEVIGNTALKHGGSPTSWIEIYTDKAGNLITTYPIPKP